MGSWALRWPLPSFKRIRWDNIYRIGKEGLRPLKITTGQVLQHIGCPHAARERMAEIGYPVSLAGKNGQTVKLPLKGCSFCDVAVDKGFYGALDMETVMSQIHCLPEVSDGRKIPFELINENPLPGLPCLLNEVRGSKYEKGTKLLQSYHTVTEYVPHSKT